MDPKFKNPAYFQNEIVPKDALLVGLAALVHAFGVEAPVRRSLPWFLFQRECVSNKYVIVNNMKSDDKVHDVMSAIT